MWILEFVLQDNIFLLFVHNSRNLFTLLLRSLRTYRASALNIFGFVYGGPFGHFLHSAWALSVNTRNQNCS